MHSFCNGRKIVQVHSFCNGRKIVQVHSFRNGEVFCYIFSLMEERKKERNEINVKRVYSHVNAHIV